MITDALMKEIAFRNLPPLVSCPVLLLCGNPELGSVLRSEDVDFATTHFPHLEVLNMQSVGHSLVPISQLPQVIGFIDSVESYGPG